MKTLARMKGKVPQIAEEDKAKPDENEQNLAEALSKAIDESIEKGLSGKFKKIGGFHPSNISSGFRYRRVHYILLKKENLENNTYSKALQLSL